MQVVAEEVFSVTAGRTQCERNAKNGRVLSISFSGSTVAPSAREYTELEFLDQSDRERFCAYIATMVAFSDTAATTPAVVPRKLSVTSPSTADAAALPGSCVRMPSFVDTSVLWSRLWPHDEVRLWVGTYNVSGSPPPADSTDLDKWLPAPKRDPDGARDLYVVGFQELGSATNREAWVAAVTKHIIGDFSTSGTDKAYVLLESIHMWEMGIYVFIRLAQLNDITNVCRAELPTGLAVAKAITGVQLGNKGAVGVSFRWRETTFAFVNCHLPARPDLIRLKKREADFKTIVRKLKLDSAVAGVGLDWIHQVCFFITGLCFERCQCI